MTDKDSNIKFGTFGGVFLPSILTIFGLVMFMRTGMLVGTFGVYGTLVILCLAEAIAIATGLSISAISTNTPVSGGGAYFLISRALGPGFGGAIGICLYLAQAVSIPFYIVGFSESVVCIWPFLEQYRLLINLAPLVIMFAVAMHSTDWAIKTQYFIFTILMLGICAFLGGAIWNIAHNGAIVENLYESSEFPRTLSPFYYFAIFFPAVTGFLSGVNMSGDLKNPTRSLPRGTMFAILFGFAVYASQIVLTGLAWPRAELLNSPFNTLVHGAIFGTGFLVTAGVMCATLSSALGSLLGAPRILQALALDKIFLNIRYFAAGRGKSREPIRAMVLSFAIAAAVLIWAASQDASKANDAMNPINIVAEAVAMFNLFTYALINLAAFVESFGANPSFRPTFKFFSWHIALFGFITSIIISLLINPPIAVLSLIILIGLYLVARRRNMEINFGDARRGLIFTTIRKNILTLSKMPEDSKNWRPRIAVMVNGINHASLLRFAEFFNNRRGLVTTISIIPKEDESTDIQTKSEIQKQISDFAHMNDATFFSSVIAAENTDMALNTYLQSINNNNPISPNTILCGWPHSTDRHRPFLEHINTIISLNFNCIISCNPDYPVATDGPIDIWWRGRQNGSLMLILAYLLQCNPQFKNHQLRLIRVYANEDKDEARKEMENLLTTARMNAEIKLIPNTKDFNATFKTTSYSAAAIFIGFIKPTSAEFDMFATSKTELLQDMPTTFLICSNGDADLTK